MKPIGFLCTFVTILFLTLSCTSPSKSTTSLGQQDWDSCRKDTDCIVVKGPCYMPKAIRKEATDDFEAYKEKVEQTYACAVDGRPQWRENVSSRCENGKCRPVYSQKVIENQ